MYIAIIEDDVDQADMIAIWLQASGHVPIIFHSGEAFLKHGTLSEFDILIIDWELPGISGVDIMKKVRNELGWNKAILFATRHDSKDDIVTVLEQGADDYMVKPIDRGELIARLRSLKRRLLESQAEPDYKINVGEFMLDDRAHRLTRNNVIVELTPKEYELVSYLFRNIDQVLSRTNLLQHVWGCNADINTRTVDTHISRVRKKLELTPENGWRLESIYHYGYRLEKLAATESA